MPKKKDYSVDVYIEASVSMIVEASSRVQAERLALKHIDISTDNSTVSVFVDHVDIQKKLAEVY
jgi:hypothetical protein